MTDNFELVSKRYGKTFRMIMEADENAVIVCDSEAHCRYISKLAKELGRNDLIFWGKNRTKKRDNFRGMARKVLLLPDIYLDDIQKLNILEYEAIRRGRTKHTTDG